MEKYDNSLLILLIGSNPLPNYLAACCLRPQKLVLVYTNETEEAMERLKKTLRPVLKNTTLDDHLISDATCATTITRSILEIFHENEQPSPILLNYTGGTKVMSAHALKAFYEKGGLSSYASYLDEGNRDRPPRLRFDDGNSKLLTEYPDVPLSLKTILALHGIDYTPRQPKNPAPTIQDAKNILHKVLESPDLAKKLYDERKRILSEKNDDTQVDKQEKPNTSTPPFRLEEHGLSLTISDISEIEAMNEKPRKRWAKFIGGEWLEEWLGDVIKTLSLSPTPEVTVGINAQRGERKAELEMDIVVVRGHRSYFISCTTDATKPLCKSKIFELVVRSRQLGGDLARSALVCLAPDDIVGKLKKDIEELWGSTNPTEVFGISHLQNWSGYDGRQVNLEELKTCLES